MCGPINEDYPQNVQREQIFKKWFEERGYEVVLEQDIPTPDLEENTLSKELNIDDVHVNWLAMTTRKQIELAKCDELFLLCGWEKTATGVIIYATALKLGITTYMDSGKGLLRIVNKPDDTRDWLEKQFED